MESKVFFSGSLGERLPHGYRPSSLRPRTLQTFATPKNQGLRIFSHQRHQMTHTSEKIFVLVSIFWWGTSFLQKTASTMVPPSFIVTKHVGTPHTPCFFNLHWVIYCDLLSNIISVKLLLFFTALFKARNARSGR